MGVRSTEGDVISLALMGEKPGYREWLLLLWTWVGHGLPHLGVVRQVLIINTDVAEPLLSNWQKGSLLETPKSTYTGGDCRHTAESDMTHVALAREVPEGWLQDRYATIMTVVQAVVAHSPLVAPEKGCIHGFTWES